MFGIVSSSLWYFCTSEIHFLFNRCVDNVDNQHFLLANDKPQIKYDKMRQMKKRKPKKMISNVAAILNFGYSMCECVCVWPCGNRPLEWNRKSKHSCNCPWAHRWPTIGLRGPANTLCTYLNGWICAQCVVTEIRDNCRKSLPSSKHRRSVYCANEHRSCAAIRLAVCHQHEHTGWFWRLSLTLYHRTWKNCFLLLLSLYVWSWLRGIQRYIRLRNIS